MTASRSVLLVVVLYLLHQDLWFWNTATPVVLGVLPIGLFYHVAYTLATAMVLWLIVSRQWPSSLEHDVTEVPRPSSRAGVPDVDR